MRLIAQRVARASAEVDGFVAHRVGTGVVLFVAVQKGDTVAAAEKLACELVRMQIWPEIGNLDSANKTNVQENGFEILVVLQQTLLAAFPKQAPVFTAAQSDALAKPIYEAFIKKLQDEYQEEMVVGVELSEDIRVDMTVECPGVFELDSGKMVDQVKQDKAALLAATAEQIDPTVASVTRALQRLPLLPKQMIAKETIKIFRTLGLKSFREAMTETDQSETDVFVETLEDVGYLFSKDQQAKITKSLGVTIIPKEPNGEDLEGKIDQQLADLEEDVKSSGSVKMEAAGPRTSADWRGRAAPATPGSLQRPLPWQRAPAGATSKGVKGKGKGRGVRGIGGIVSLDESARLHGLSSAPYHACQLNRYSDRELVFTKEEQDEDSKGTKRPATAPGPVRKFAKGVPTVAPMTPAPGTVDKADVDY